MTDKLIDRIKAGSKWGGTCTDASYVREMEARILADDKIIKAAAELAEQAAGWLDGGSGKTYDGSLSEAVASYRAAASEARQ